MILKPKVTSNRVCKMRVGVREVADALPFKVFLCAVAGVSADDTIIGGVHIATNRRVPPLIRDHLTQKTRLPGRSSRKE